MTGDNPPLAEHSAYREVVRSAISRIPSLFGRLTFIAGFRDLESNRYKLDSAAVHFEPAAMEVLRQEHLEIFEAWLSLSLEEQAADLVAYLQEHLGGRKETIRKWRQEVSYIRLIPDAALAPQQKLFRSDLEIVLNLLSGTAR